MGRPSSPQTHPPCWRAWRDESLHVFEKPIVAHFFTLASNRQCLLQLCTISIKICKADLVSVNPTKSSANKRPDILLLENLTANSECFLITFSRVTKNSARGQRPSALFLVTRPEASTDKSDSTRKNHVLIVLM